MSHQHHHHDHGHGHGHDHHGHDHHKHKKHKKHKDCGCKKRHSKCGGCRSRCCFPVVFTQVVGTNYCNPFASCCRPRGCGC